MQLGITQSEGKTLCLNCGLDITGKTCRFCPKCGSPLTQPAVEKYLENILFEKRELIRDLTRISKEIKSENLNQVLDRLFEENSDL